MKARDGQRKENFLVSARNELSKYRPIKYMAESAYMRKIEYQKKKIDTTHTQTHLQNPENKRDLQSQKAIWFARGKCTTMQIASALDHTGC